MVNKIKSNPETMKSKFDLTKTMDLKWSIKNLINIAANKRPKQKLDAIKISMGPKLKIDTDEPK